LYYFSRFLSQLASELLAKETLNYKDVEALIGPPPYGRKRLIGPEEFEIGVNEEAGIDSNSPSSQAPTAPPPEEPKQA
jgi:spastic paraplegia protein 7